MSDDTQTLPSLRQDIRLQPGEHPGDWQLYDPWQHLFFRIGEEDLLFLSRPNCRTLGDLKQTLAAQGETLDTGQFRAFVQFLQQHRLVSGQPWESLVSASASRLLSAPRMIHVPLWDPVPMLQFIASMRIPGVWAILWFLWGAVTLSGVWLVARQWDSYLATFHQFTTASAMVSFGVALVVLKICHELGHAAVALRQGAMPGKMGVAVYLVFPLLYTDLTRAQMITNPHKRMWIALGGIIAESLVAGLATAAWAVLPPGTLRGVCFVVATTSWVTTLALNLNPLARFDGYYFLSDLLRVENLQPRAFALMRYYGYRLLFGKVVAPPEPLQGARVKLMACYGVLVFIYQRSLVLGIGYFAWHFLFPALGLAVFAWFVVHYVLVPVVQMTKTSLGYRQRLHPVRRAALLLLLLAGVGVFIVPLPASVNVPAIASYQVQQPITVPENAQLVHLAVRDGQQVTAGQLVMQFRSPELTFRYQETELNRDLLQFRLDRIGGSDSEKVETLVLRQQLEEARDNLAGLEKQREQLTWRAAVAGRVVDLKPGLAVGQWVDPSQVLARVVQPEHWDVSGYVDERYINGLKPGLTGKFIPDAPTLPAVAVRIARLDPGSAEFIAPPALSSLWGGKIDSLKGEQGEAIPLVAMHRIAFTLDNQRYAGQQILQGDVVLPLAPESLITRIGRRVWQIVIAELNQ